jgi:hypothetical protein
VVVGGVLLDCKQIPVLVKIGQQLLTLLHKDLLAFLRVSTSQFKRCEQEVETKIESKFYVKYTFPYVLQFFFFLENKEIS